MQFGDAVGSVCGGDVDVTGISTIETSGDTDGDCAWISGEGVVMSVVGVGMLTKAVDGIGVIVVDVTWPVVPPVVVIVIGKSCPRGRSICIPSQSVGFMQTRIVLSCTKGLFATSTTVVPIVTVFMFVPGPGLRFIKN